MGAAHSHVDSHASIRALLMALILTSTFLVVELVGGIVTGSLALISDAAHMFTDVAALAIALGAVQIAKQPANAKKTFGYYRFEILAAALNAALLFGVGFYILFEAYQRFKSPPDIASEGMFIIALIGLFVNLLSMKILHFGKEQSLNLKSAYLEVWSDALGSAGVIIAAICLYLTGWGWIDSFVAVVIGLWILPRTYLLLKESVNILLEGVPEGIDVEHVEAAIAEVAGVKSLHELHIWALTSGKVSLTAHVVYDVSQTNESVLIRHLKSKMEAFGITHTTFQCETVPCEDEKKGCCLS